MTWNAAFGRALILRSGSLEAVMATLAGGASIDGEGIRFRVWAPNSRSVDVVFEEASLAPLQLAAAQDGYFSASRRGLKAGTRYRFRLDGGEPYPDPYSRFQPEGPHGPSMIVDPRAYEWHDAEWRGLQPARQIFYELHIGAF